MRLDAVILTQQIVAQFEAREEDKPGLAIVWEVLRKAHHHESWALVSEDREIVAIGMFYEMWKGCAEVCLAIAKGVSRSPYNPIMRKICVMVKDYLKTAFYAHQLRRMQAHIADGNPARLRFAKWLDMEPEALMRKWGPNGEDFYLYAKVKE